MKNSIIGTLGSLAAKFAAIALVAVAAGATFPASGATTQVASQTDLATAVANAAAGDTVQITAAGTYTMPAIPRNITIEGTVDGVAFNCAGSGSICKVSNGATIKNVSFTFGNNDYHGWQEQGGVLMFEHCAFDGKFFSYGNMTFSECGFVNTVGDYCMWCYDGDLVYDSCSFTNTVKSKFLNVYNEGNGAHKLAVIGCTFVSSGSASKAALNVKATCGAKALAYDVVVSDSTTEGSFPTAETSDANNFIDSLVQVDDINASVASEILVVEGEDIVLDESGDIVSASSLSVAYVDEASEGVSAVIAEGSGMTDNGDGTYTVAVDPYAAYTKVADGFYQNAATYAASTDFYITSKAGLLYFRTLVNADDGGTIADAYAKAHIGSTSTAVQFYQGNIFTGKTVHLMEDVDMENADWTPIGYPHADFNSGNSKTYFYGNFNGEGHTISNIKVVANEYNQSNPSKSWKNYGAYGLFGFIGAPNGSNQTFANLTVHNFSAVSGTVPAETAGTYIGAIVGNGSSNPITFSNCHVTGLINISCSNENFVGGLFGLGSATVTGCSVEGDEGSSISGSTVGGIAGTATRSAATTISDTTVSGVAVVSSESYGTAGGLVGQVNNYDNVVITGNTVSNITVTVTGADDKTAGLLVGYSYAAGNNILKVTDNTIEDTTATQSGTATTASVGAGIANAVVGNDVTFDESGKVTGGIFESIPTSAIAEGYLSIDNLDEETSASYPLTIGGPYVAVVYDENGAFKSGHATLAAAVAAAQSGETVSVLAGTFEIGGDTVVIDKSITITGQGKDETTLNFTATGKAAFSIAASNVTMENMTINQADTSTDNTMHVAIAYTGSSASPTVAYSDIALQNLKFTGGKYSLAIYAEDLTIDSCDFLEQGSSCILLYCVKGNSAITGNNFVQTSPSGQGGFIYGTTASGNDYSSGTLTISGNTATGGRCLYHCNNQDYIDTTTKLTLEITGNVATNYNNKAIVFAGHSNVALGSVFNSITITNNALFTSANRPTIQRDDSDTSSLAIDASANYWGSSTPDFDTPVSGDKYLIMPHTDGNNIAVESYYQTFDETTGELSNLYVVPAPVALVVSADGTTTNKYESLEDAIAAAATGDTVTLLDDYVMTNALNVIGKSLDIDLGGNTLKITANANRLASGGVTTTITNGVIDISGAGANTGTAGIFSAGHPLTGAANGGNTINLTDVTLTGMNYYGHAVFQLYANCALNIEDSTVGLTNCLYTSGGFVKSDGSSYVVPITIRNSTVDLVNTQRGFLDGQTAIVDSTMRIVDDRAIAGDTVAKLDNGFNYNATTGDGTCIAITNSAVTISGGTGRGITLNGKDVIVADGSTLAISDMGEGDIKFKKGSADNVVTATDDSHVTAGTVVLDSSVTSPASELLIADTTSTVPTFAAQIERVPYATFAEAIAAAEAYYAANGSYPTITVLDATAEQTNPDWKIADGYLVKKVYVAQIVVNEGATTNKYESLLDAYGNSASGDTIELLADDYSLTGGDELFITHAITITGPVDANGNPLYTIYGSSNYVTYNDIFIKGTTAIDVTIENVKLSNFGDQSSSNISDVPGVIWVSAQTHADTHVVVSNVVISSFNYAAIKMYSGALDVVDCLIDCAKTVPDATTKGLELGAAATVSSVTPVVNVIRTEIINNTCDAYDTAAIEAWQNTKLTVSDCTMTNVWMGIYACGSSFVTGDASGDSVSVTVTNTLVEADAAAIGIAEEGGTTVPSMVSIQSGTFSGGLAISDEMAGYGTIAISGGMFDAEVPEEYCADGYIPAGQDPETGLYTVKTGYARGDTPEINGATTHPLTEAEATLLNGLVAQYDAAAVETALAGMESVEAFEKAAMLNIDITKPYVEPTFAITSVRRSGANVLVTVTLDRKGYELANKINGVLTLATSSDGKVWGEGVEVEIDDDDFSGNGTTATVTLPAASNANFFKATISGEE